MNNKTFETTTEKLNRAVWNLEQIGFTRQQAIDKTVEELKKGGSDWLAEYARINLSS